MGSASNSPVAPYFLIGNATGCSMSYVVDGSAPSGVLTSGQSFFVNTTAGVHSVRFTGCGYTVTQNETADSTGNRYLYVVCGGTYYSYQIN
jgi:hypothetical protein